MVHCNEVNWVNLIFPKFCLILYIPQHLNFHQKVMNSSPDNVKDTTGILSICNKNYDLVGHILAYVKQCTYIN
jgi:hypothetical protein